MERKTKQRILGIFVVIGFIIILLPFFQSSNDISGEQSIVKAPPFPDQTVQVTDGAQAQNSISDAITTDNEPTTQLNAEANSKVNSPVNDLMGVNRPSIVNNEKPSSIPDKIDTSVMKAENNLVLETTEIKPQAYTTKEQRSSIKQNNKKLVTAKNSKLEDNNANGLVEIKQAAWVIQIGSFKNKANALRLVNQLRSKGYQAFIQQVSTSAGSSTRVFVGPENKRSAANALVNRLETDMQLHGIVISYQPLTL